MNDRWKGRSTPRLSVCLLTRNSSARIAALLKVVRGFADEIVVAVDVSSTDGTEAVVRKFADKTLLVESPGYIEAVLSWLGRQCSGDWVLRLDDDEWPSQRLIESLPGLLNDGRFSHYLVPRRWVSPWDQTAFLAQEPWWPDRQLRLFRNLECLVDAEPTLHSSHRVLGQGGLSSGAIYHYDLAWHDEVSRWRKVARYAEFSPNSFLGGYYFPDKTSVHCEPFPKGDGPAVTRPLLPRWPGPVRRISSDEILGAKVFEVASADALGVCLSSGLVPTQLACSTATSVEVEVSPATGRALGPGGIPVSLSYHWWRSDAGSGLYDGHRTPLLHRIPSGGSSVVRMHLEAPAEPGDYRLELDLVVEGVSWFSQLGMKTPSFDVQVVPWVLASSGQSGFFLPGVLIQKDLPVPGGPRGPVIFLGFDIGCVDLVQRLLGGPGEMVAVSGDLASMLNLARSNPGALFVHILSDGRFHSGAESPSESWAEAVAEARRLSFAVPHYWEVRIEDLARDRRPWDALLGYLGKPALPGLDDHIESVRLALQARTRVSGTQDWERRSEGPLRLLGYL